MLSPCHLHKNPNCPQCGLELKAKGSPYPTYYCPNPCGWTGTRESLRMTNARRRLRRIEDSTEDETLSTYVGMAAEFWKDVAMMERLAERVEGGCYE